MMAGHNDNGNDRGNGFSPDLIEAYLLGRLNEEQVAELDAVLRADPEARRRFAVSMQLMSMVREQFRGIEEQGGANQDTASSSAASAAALAELARLHEEGRNQPISLQAHRKQQQQQSETHRKVHRKARLILAGSFAALIAIAALAGLVLSTLTQQPQQFAEQPKPDEPFVVATLTDERDAVWAERDLARGSQLKAGEQFTLTQGFAEITTARGAVAIVEAPATMELLDSDNALRLHSGKLVGICETESSKGFLVRTPHIDITDLGTRFGVEVSPGSRSEVHVFTGEVRVDQPVTAAAPPQSRSLKTGQAILASEAGTADPLVTIAADLNRFTPSLPAVRITDTGGGLVSGDIDPDWRVIAVDGNPISEHGEMTVWSPPDNDAARADTKWVRVNNALNPPNVKSVLFTCRSVFELPAAAAGSHELVIRARADNKLAALRINGHALSVPKNRVGVGPEWLTWTLAEHLKPGPNTIEVDIDERLPNNNKLNSSGLIAELELQTR